MKSRILLYSLMAVLFSCFATACSDDGPDGESKIQLPGDQKRNMTCYANQTSGQIRIISNAAVSAWASPAPDGLPGEVDWLTVERPSKNDGEWVVIFEMQPNLTGKSRTAYIAIVAEDEKMVFSVTQTDESDPELASPSRNGLDYVFQDWLMHNFDGNIYTYDKEKRRVTRIEGNAGKATFNYVGDIVEVKDTNGRRWVLHLACNNIAFAEMIEYYDPDGSQRTYLLDYDPEGHLTQFTQMKGDKVYERSLLEWRYGDLASVQTTFDGGMTYCTFEYSDITNHGRLMMYDTQCWVDADDMEMFYFCGFLGVPTIHLIKAFHATETADKEYKFNSTFDYTLDSNGLPAKMIFTETEEGQGTSTGQYDFTYKRRDF